MILPILIVLAVVPELPSKGKEIQRVWGVRPEYTQNAVHVGNLAVNAVAQHVVTSSTFPVARQGAPRLLRGTTLGKRRSASGDGENAAPLRTLQPQRRAVGFKSRSFAVIPGRKV